MKRIAVVGLGLAATLGTHSAMADLLLDSSAGVKVLGGADIWSTPSGIPGNYDGLGFAGSGGGFSYGALGYYELRLIKLLALEADLSYQHGVFYRNVTINDVAEYRETVTVDSWRLPILAKLTIPVGFGRVWAGLGPEFTISQSASGKVERTDGADDRVDFATREPKPTFATFGLGLVVEIPGTGLEIPVEFRGSKNLSQPSDWTDRVAGSSAASMNVRAESSWVLRLGAGLGYCF